MNRRFGSQSRYDKGDTEAERKRLFELPIVTREQYEAFIDALLAADKI